MRGWLRFEGERNPSMVKSDMFTANESTVHRVFSFDAPGALRVALVGDFTHWQQNPINLRKHYDGIWRASASLPPGTYHYRFLVDGKWRDDPECTLRVPNPYAQ